MRKNYSRWLAGVIFVLLNAVSTVGEAQNRTNIDVQVWATGDVVLTSGDTVSGPLIFYRSLDVINVQHEDGTVSSFSPVNVQYFTTREMPGGRLHTFRTYPWDQGKDYTDFKKPSFFEQLNDGPITLIMRETYIARNPTQSAALGGYSYYPSSYYSSAGSMWLEQVQEQYFALLPDGDIVKLHNVRKDLHKLFGKKSSRVKDFVKKNRLDYERPYEVVAIVDYFNSLP